MWRDGKSTVSITNLNLLIKVDILGGNIKTLN
jgi:hypothetical protein